MGETQSVMLSSFGGTWLWGSSASAARTNPPDAEGSGGRAEQAMAIAAGTPEGAASRGAGRSDVGSTGDAARLSGTEVREWGSYRPSRTSCIRTPNTWGVGRSSNRFDFGVSFRSWRVFASPERTTAATETAQKGARRYEKGFAAAACGNEMAPAPDRQDATSTPDGPAERELICSVCLELLWKPAVLDCGHSFCFWCAFQCMSLYDVSRCPLCKSTFDKFPLVNRPLDLFLLRHFPRTTGQRDKEMEEFESMRHRRSPCHSRIADLASGASTDALPAPQLRWLLEQKAPDLIRPAAARIGSWTLRGGDRTQGKHSKSHCMFATFQGVFREEESSAPRAAEAGAGSNRRTQRPAAAENSRCTRDPRAPGRRRTEREDSAGVPGGRQRLSVADRGMLSSRRHLHAGGELGSPARPVHTMNADVRGSSPGSRNAGRSPGGSAGDLEESSNRQETHVLGSPRASFIERGRSVRSETVQEGAASASVHPRSSTRCTPARGVSGGTRARLAENVNTAGVTSFHPGPRSTMIEESGAVRLQNPEGVEHVPGLHCEGEGEMCFDPNNSDAQLFSTTFASGPGRAASHVHFTDGLRGQEHGVGSERPAAVMSGEGRSFLPPIIASTINGQARAPVQGNAESRGPRASASEAAVFEDCSELDGLDEGDVSLGLLDPGGLATGHRRNPGDEPLQPMDIEEQELSGNTEAGEDGIAFGGGFRPNSARSSVTESEPSRLGDVEDEVTRPSNARGEVHQDAHDTDAHGTLFEEHPAFNESLLTVEDFVHYGVHCDGCGKMPIVGRRHRCLDCSKEASGFELCGTCKDAGYDKPGRFDQNHSSKHRMKAVQPRDAEWWIQSLNRMKKIHPDLTIHQILQWILVHYQEMSGPDEQPREEAAPTSRRQSGRARAGLD